MQIRHFTFAELIATSRSVANVPNWEQVENLMQLASFLDRVRIEFGAAIRVNSGFRSDLLNAAVGGSKTSAHMQGLAADICAWSGSTIDNRRLLAILEHHLADIDQLISYHAIAGDNDSKIRFIHVGLSRGRPRAQRLFK